MSDEIYNRERDPYRGDIDNPVNVVNQVVPDKRDNNQIIKLVMVFPPSGIVRYG